MRRRHLHARVHHFHQHAALADLRRLNTCVNVWHDRTAERQRGRQVEQARSDERADAVTDAVVAAIIPLEDMVVRQAATYANVACQCRRARLLTASGLT